jgi:hypothetical protein
MCRERRVRNLVTVGLIHTYRVLVIDGSNLSFGNIDHKSGAIFAGAVKTHEIA